MIGKDSDRLTLTGKECMKSTPLQVWTYKKTVASKNRI